MEATRLDMTMMLAMHDALRRDLAEIARLAARAGDDPRRLLRTALGWQLFKDFLEVHHGAEDATLWPMLVDAVAGRPDDLALLKEIEAEHAAIDPIVAAIDLAVADPGGGPQRLGDLVDDLVTVLGGHLAHEEKAALPLIDATLTGEQWLRFGADHRARVGDRTPTWLPWILEGADPGYATTILSRMPEHLRTVTPLVRWP